MRPSTDRSLKPIADGRRWNFVPDPGQMALRPQVSGNTINGLGERAVRRPTPVYWQKPASIAHGRMQEWFEQRPIGESVRAALARRQAVMDTPMPERAETRQRKSPREWSAGVRERALAFDADLVGVTAFRAGWVYADRAPPRYPWCIVLGVGQDYAQMRYAPQEPAGTEVLVQYGRILSAARRLSGWIRTQGWDAEPFGSPTPATFPLIPAAIAAGFGELGKHGSIINRIWGANFRLAAVLTDLPLQADRADVFGADEFCRNCRVCEKACPVDAIAPLPQLVRGVERWYVDFDRCQPFFNEHLGCSICTTVCPWSRPGIAPGLLAKMARRSLPVERAGAAGQ